MVGNQRPAVTWGIRVGEDITEAFDKPIAITVIGKYRVTIDTPEDDVVQRTGVFLSKNEKRPKPVKGLSGVYSLKRLSEVL